MVRKNRDSKFIIYQVLYIFVITVLAIKGANLNLHAVVPKDKAVSMTVRDSLVNLIDSLYTQGTKFDIQINPIKEENVQLKHKLTSLNKKIQKLTSTTKTEVHLPPKIDKNDINSAINEIIAGLRIIENFIFSTALSTNFSISLSSPFLLNKSFIELFV